MGPEAKPVSLDYCESCGHETVHDAETGDCIGCQCHLENEDGETVFVGSDGERYPMPDPEDLTEIRVPAGCSQPPFSAFIEKIEDALADVDFDTAESAALGLVSRIRREKARQAQGGAD